MVTVVNEPEIDMQLGNLLNEFKSLLRKGQGIPVREFARRYPYHSDRIIAEFPALLIADGLMPKPCSTSETTAPSSTDATPTALAGYRVIRQISKGSTGVVYEAEHPQLLRRLAIRTFPARKGEPGSSEKFRREAKAASRLNHPNIVTVYDFGEHDGVKYLTMPFIEGISLESLLEDYRSQTQPRSNMQSQPGPLATGTIPPEETEAANAQSRGSRGSAESHVSPQKLIGPKADFRRLAKLGSDIAAALAHAHSAGTVHGDIGPGNLILSKDGKIWVANFGAPQNDEDKSDHGRTGSADVKTDVTALEKMQCPGDARSDIHALGMTLYEMASGKRAWASLNTSQLLNVRASAEPLDLAEQSPYVPKPLAEIIMKACSSRPEDRYQSAKELQVVLSRFAQGEKVPDRRRRPRNKSSKFDRRWVVASTSLGIPAVVFLLLGLYSIIASNPEQVASRGTVIIPIEHNAAFDQKAERLSHEKTIKAEAMVSRNRPADGTVSDKVTQLMDQVIEAQHQSVDEETADRVTQLMDQVIEAQHQSVDEETADRVTQLMDQVVEAQHQSADGETSDSVTQLMDEIIRTSGATTETAEKDMHRIRITSPRPKEAKFIYDEMDHPLTNAIRNLDLARQISSLRLSSADKQSSLAKTATLGEAIRRKLVSEKQTQELLSYLPPEAQTRKTDKEVSDPMLLRFLLALNRTFEAIRNSSSDSQQLMQNEEEKNAPRGARKPDRESAEELASELQDDLSTENPPKLPTENNDDLKKLPPF